MHEFCYFNFFIIILYIKISNNFNLGLKIYIKYLIKKIYLFISD